MSEPHVLDVIATESAAYRALERIRWCESRPECPHCGGYGASLLVPVNGVSRVTSAGSLSERRVWRCELCYGQFSVLTGSVLHGAKLSLRAVVGQLATPLHIRGLMRLHGFCFRSARRVTDMAESIRSDGLVQVRATGFSGVDVLDTRPRLMWLDAPMTGTGGSYHDRVSTEGAWDDPVFDAVLLRLHDEDIEVRRRVLEWNDDHRERQPRPADLTDYAKAVAFSRGATGRKSSNHRGRTSRAASAQGKRSSRSQPKDRR